MHNSEQKFGLPVTALKAINQVFENHPKIKHVILYGSRAKGNYRRNSDIDLCIEGKLDLSELLLIENEIDELLLPWKVDLSLKHQIDNSDLLDHINRVGITIFPIQ